MKKLVFGSLNLDKTYLLKRFTKPGETVSAIDFTCCCGGKGFNLAVAMSRAGDEVWMAGSVGSDGQVFYDTLTREGVRTDLLRRSEYPNGHAVIEADEKGQNSIIVVAGSNGDIPIGYVDEVLSHFEAGDLIILQNEISNVAYIMRRAKQRGLRIAYNPSPINDQLVSCDLSWADYLFVNEVEGELLTGEKDWEGMMRVLRQKYPAQTVILTLGERGSCYEDAEGLRFCCGILPVKAVDSTAAGDTFMGYFLSEHLKSGDALLALQRAAIASGLAVSRQGASDSIPYARETDVVNFTELKGFT